MAKKRKTAEKPRRADEVTQGAASESPSVPAAISGTPPAAVSPDVGAGLGNEPGLSTQADTGEIGRERQREPLTAAQTDGIDDTEEIAQRAYERFLARGGEHGRDQEDWYEAEQSVRGAEKSR